MYTFGTYVHMLRTVAYCDRCTAQAEQILQGLTALDKASDPVSRSITGSFSSTSRPSCRPSDTCGSLRSRGGTPKRSSSLRSCVVQATQQMGFQTRHRADSEGGPFPWDRELQSTPNLEQRQKPSGRSSESALRSLCEEHLSVRDDNNGRSSCRRHGQTGAHGRSATDRRGYGELHTGHSERTGSGRVDDRVPPLLPLYGHRDQAEAISSRIRSPCCVTTQLWAGPAKRVLCFVVLSGSSGTVHTGDGALGGTSASRSARTKRSGSCRK